MGKFHFVDDAFRALGHDVIHIQTLPELKAADESCDFILFEQRNGPIHTIDGAEIGKRRKSIWCEWFFDLNVFDPLLPIDLQPTVEPYLPLLKQMDIVFVKERDRLDEYRKAGIKATWLDQGCPSNMPEAEFNPNPMFDCIIWGSSRPEIWRQRRDDVQTAVDAGYRVAWAATDQYLPSGVIRLPSCQPLELPGLIELAKVSLCVDATQSIDGYWSDRIWLAAGAGACIVRRASAGGMYLPAVHYNSQHSLRSVLAQLCGNDEQSIEQRRLFGEQARKSVMSRNTYEHRCQEIVNHVVSLTHQGHEESHLPDLSGQEGNQNQEARQERDVAMSCLH